MSKQRTQTETEIKVRLTKQDYDKVFKPFVSMALRRILQTNYYLDTPDKDMERLGQTIRIRHRGNKLILTQKLNASNDGQVQTCKEREWEIVIKPDPKEPISVERAQKEFLDHPHFAYPFPLEDLECTGSTKTERWNLPYQHLLFELDKTTYPFGVDYELEVETPDPKEDLKVVKAFLGSVGVEYVPETRTKLARLREGLSQ